MNPNEPLGLPRGSVRAILALMVVGTMCALSIVGRLDVAILAGLGGMALNAYFEQRRPTRR